MSHRRCCCDAEPQPCPVDCGACPDTLTVRINGGTLEQVPGGLPICLCEVDGFFDTVIIKLGGSNSCLWGTTADAPVPITCENDEIEDCDYSYDINLRCFQEKWEIVITVFLSPSCFSELHYELPSSSCPVHAEYPFAFDSVSPSGTSCWLTYPTVEVL